MSLPKFGDPYPASTVKITSIKATPQRRSLIDWLLRRPKLVWNVTVTYEPADE